MLPVIFMLSVSCEMRPAVYDAANRARPAKGAHPSL
jgi:hypothetical protein